MNNKPVNKEFITTTLKKIILFSCPITRILHEYEISYLPPREEFQKISELYIWQHGYPNRRESKAGNEFKVCLLKAK